MTTDNKNHTKAKPVSFLESMKYPTISSMLNNNVENSDGRTNLRPTDLYEFPDGLTACLKRQEFLKQSWEVKRETELDLYAAIGNGIEEYVLRGLKSNLLTSQYSFTIEINGKKEFSGKFDGLIKHNGKLFILEIKTTTSKNLPNKKHLAQAKSYSSVFNLPVILLYVTRPPLKGTEPFVQFNIEPDEDFSLKLFKTIYLNYLSNLKGEFEKSVYNKKNCRDIYCDFVDICHFGGVDEKLVKIEKTLENKAKKWALEQIQQSKIRQISIMKEFS